MRRNRFLPWLLLVLLCWPLPGAAFRLRDEHGKALHEVAAAAHFQAGVLPQGVHVQADLHALLEVVDSTQSYLKANEGDVGDPAVGPGLFSELGITLEDVWGTLHYVQRVLGEDIDQPPARQRMLQPAFLRQHFRVLAWRSDVEAARRFKIALPAERIRLTQYVVYRTDGRLSRDTTYNYALYALPADEAGLKAPEAEQQRAKLWRYRFTKQDVLAGAFDPGGQAAGQAQPLVWLTRRGLEEALLEGTLVVHLPGQGERVYNVHRNNGIAYDRSLKDTKLQRRYWYFRQVDGIKGYGTEIENKITIRPGVSFAGDVVNLGLGKLIAIEYPDAAGHPQLRLGVLADTGGAFLPNLYQLDYLTGIFDSPAQFQQAAASLPATVKAYVLIAK